MTDYNQMSELSEEILKKDYAKHLMIGGGTGGLVLVRGKGVRVEDITGKSYIDCTAQSWALYLGYAHPEIAGAIASAASNLTQVHQGFHTRQRYFLAKKLADLAPGNLNKVGFTVGGGPAVESAMKIALKNRKGAKNFISLWDGYHGSTLGTIGASYTSTQASGEFTGAVNFLPVTHDFVRVPNPYCYRCYFGQKPESCSLTCALMLELTIQKGISGPCAGVIMEPIQGAGGQVIFPKRYLKRVREICDKYDVPLIFDEIQTFCRVGDWFASTLFGVEPDIIVLGKALGGGTPIAAIIINDKNLTGFEPTSEDLHTFASNQISQAAAIKMIEIIERDNVLQNAVAMGQYLRRGIEKMQEDYPEIGDIRQIGLHIGVEFVRDPEGKEPLIEKTMAIQRKGPENGVIFGLSSVHRNVLNIKPPLIINRREADEILSVLAKCIKKVICQ
ncbi:MAG: Taurine--pyruvate aminotransferase [Firmicutes bacterium]|nr:Taurine--pyruvate aminotransferase [Bacillota bacterium]